MQLESTTPDTFYDIYGLSYVPFWHKSYFLLSLIFIGFVLVAIMLYVSVRWHKKKQVLASIPFDQQVLQELDRLLMTIHARCADSTQVYASLIYTIKKYVAWRYCGHLLSKTDHQMIQHLLVLMNEQELRLLQNILENSVLARFANQQAMSDRLQYDTQQAIALVKKTSQQLAGSSVAPCNHCFPPAAN